MKNTKNIKIQTLAKNLAICMAVVVIGAMAVGKYRQEQLAEALSDKIIRFHVLANSDSQEDQELKLQVRDAVGAYLHRELAEADDAGDSRRIIRQDMRKIAEYAENMIKTQGYDYPVRAALVKTDFPEKTYGDFTFPAGKYEALRLTIGQGKGKNWWCVMYPNMCFQGSVYEVVEEEAEEALQQVLTEEEYKALQENGEFEVKFKWLTFLNEKP